MTTAQTTSSKKVSVIVPIYNAENFLNKTIRSIQEQTHENLEIILVNDKSTDNSLKICREYEKSDPRIIVVDKPVNQGEDYARFSGIEAATGDYLAFLDADDWMTPDAIQHQLKIAETTSVDIVYSNYQRVISTKLHIKRKFIPFPDELVDHIITGEEKRELSISHFGTNKVPVTMWGALFDAKLFKEPLQPSGLQFRADLLMTMQLYARAKSLYLTNNIAVYYRWGGITSGSGYKPNYLKCSKEAFRRKFEFLPNIPNKNARITSIVELANCLAAHVLQLAEYMPDKRDENIEILQKELKDPLYKVFNEIKGLEYLKDKQIRTACVNFDAERAYDLAVAFHNNPIRKIKMYNWKLASKILKKSSL